MHYKEFLPVYDLIFNKVEFNVVFFFSCEFLVFLNKCFLGIGS